MVRKSVLGDFEHLKRYFEKLSYPEIDEEDILILTSTLEDPLTMEEISYSTGLKIVACVNKVRKLMEAGVLVRFHPESEKGKKRGGLFVYQLSEDIATDLGALRVQRY